MLDQRRELVMLLRSGSISVSEAARRFGVHRDTARRWRDRHEAGGDEALRDLSRRPARSPTRSPPEVELAAAALRREHPAWGGRKIATLLERDGVGAVAPSTVTKILRRAGLVEDRERPAPHRARLRGWRITSV